MKGKKGMKGMKCMKGIKGMKGMSGAGLKGLYEKSCRHDFSPKKIMSCLIRGAAGGQETRHDFLFAGPAGRRQDMILFSRPAWRQDMIFRSQKSCLVSRPARDGLKYLISNGFL